MFAGFLINSERILGVSFIVVIKLFIQPLSEKLPPITCVLPFGSFIGSPSFTTSLWSIILKNWLRPCEMPLNNQRSNPLEKIAIGISSALPMKGNTFFFLIVFAATIKPCMPQAAFV